MRRHTTELPSGRQVGLKGLEAGGPHELKDSCTPTFEGVEVSWVSC